MDLRRKFIAHGLRSEGKDLDSIRSMCYADKRHTATVNYNGDVFKCTAEDFTKENRNGYLTAEGDIVITQDSYEEILEKRYKKEQCRTCRVMPLCNGGCNKKIRRNPLEWCLFPTEEDKNQLVLENIEEALLNRNPT